MEAEKWDLELPKIREKHVHEPLDAKEKRAPQDPIEKAKKAPDLNVLGVDDRFQEKLESDWNSAGTAKEPSLLDRHRVKGLNDIDAQRKAFKREAEQTPGCISYEMNNLSPSDGVILQIPAYANDAPTLSSAGPINGGSIPAYAVCIPITYAPIGYGPGQVIFVYGGPNVTSVDLSNVTSQQGLIIDGTQHYDLFGLSIVPLGDFDEDGIVGDVAVSAPGIDEVYVLFAPLLNPTNLSALGIKGVTIYGPSNSQFGQCLAYGVDSAGKPLLLIGAPNALTGSNVLSGQLYGIYAHAMPGSGTLDASTLSMPAGFVINGTVNGGGFGCPLAAGSMVINGTQIPVFAAAQPSYGNTSPIFIFVGYLQNGTSQPFKFDGTDGFIATYLNSPTTSINSLALGGALGPGGTPALVIGISDSGQGQYYLLYQPSSAQFSLTTLSEPQGRQIFGPQGGDLGSSSALIDMSMSGFVGFAGGFPNNNQIVLISGQPNGISTSLSLSNMTCSQGFFVQGPAGSVSFGDVVANLGVIRGDGREALGITDPDNGNGILAILFAKTPNPVSPTPLSPATSTPQPTPGSLPSSATTPMGSQSASSLSPTVSSPQNTFFTTHKRASTTAARSVWNPNRHHCFWCSYSSAIGRGCNGRFHPPTQKESMFCR